MNETLFDEAGHEYRLAAIPEDHTLVWSQMADEDGDAYDGELRVVDTAALRSVPPKPSLDSEIAKAQAVLSDLREQLAITRRELDTFERDRDGRMARLKQHKALARLDDFLAGRLTHCVEHRSYGPPEIVAFEDAWAADDSCRPKRLRLLTLFGRTDGDLEWNLNRYSDGSGSNVTVVPCTSYTEAVSVAAEVISAHVAKALDPEEGLRTKPSRKWHDSAVAYGIAMDERYLRELEANEASKKRDAIAELEAQLHTLRGDDSARR